MAEAINKAKSIMKMPKMPAGPGVGLAVKIVSALGVTCALLSQSFYTVEGGHRAVMFSRINGTRELVVAPGTHLKIPFIEYPTIYDVRAKPHLYTSLTGSKDLQMVNVTLRVLAKPETERLPVIHRTLGPTFDDRVLPSICNEVMKAVVAQFNASQLITQRSDVSLMVGRQLRKRANDFNIVLDDVSITHLAFGNEYSRAVEEKKVAQQDAERAMILVEKARQEKAGSIIRAQGEAAAAKLIGSAARNNPGYLELLKLENAKRIATAISKSGNKVYLQSDNLLLNLLNSAAVDLGVAGVGDGAPLPAAPLVVKPASQRTEAPAAGAAAVPLTVYSS